MNVLKLIILTLSINFFFPVFAQSEFLISINPFTGIHTKIDKIPNVKWVMTTPNYTTFNENNGRYIFKGADSNMNSGLFSIDVASGNVVSSPNFPQLSDPDDNIIELQFDNITGTLYGLHWDASCQTEFLISINTQTGAHTIIDSIPNVKWITTAPGYTTFDPINGNYIFLGADANMNSKLYAIDVTNGNIVSSPPFPNLSDQNDNIIELEFDNSTGSIFGLHWDNSAQKEFLVRVNPTSGSFTIIDSIPNVRWIATGSYTTFDQNNGRYIFYGEGNTTPGQLFSIDVATGKIISHVPFPILNDSRDNIIELHYDNSTQTLYGLHWDSDLILGNNPIQEIETTQIFPNPFTEKTTIALSTAHRKVTINVFNSNGQLVRTLEKWNTKELELHKKDLSPGVYYINISADNANTIKKVIIQ